MKRVSESIQKLENEYGRPTKRFRSMSDMEGWSYPQHPTESIMLPVQREVLELGPFWTTAGVCVGSLEQQRVPGALESSGDPCPSLGSWGVEMSVSLMQRSTSGCADASDEDTQDTASSSGSESEGWERDLQQQRAPARKPRAAATGEEDSITSNHPAVAASVAFSFGSRPYLTPDLTAVQCWDVINGLLTAV